MHSRKIGLLLFPLLFLVVLASSSFLFCAEQEEIKLIGGFPINWLQKSTIYGSWYACAQKQRERANKLLAQAMKDRDMERVVRACDMGADVNHRRDVYGMCLQTPLSLAMNALDFSTVRALLYLKANPYRAMSYAYGFYESSPDKKKLYIFDDLIRNKADINVGNWSTGDTPLHRAARWHDLGFVTYLLSKKAEVNKRDEYGCTPLHCATRSEDIARLLLVAKANVLAKTDAGYSVLRYHIDGEAERRFKQSASLSLLCQETEKARDELDKKNRQKMFKQPRLRRALRLRRGMRRPIIDRKNAEEKKEEEYPWRSLS